MVITGLHMDRFIFGWPAYWETLAFNLSILLTTVNISDLAAGTKPDSRGLMLTEPKEVYHG